jgi:hypothetical protein
MAPGCFIMGESIASASSTFHGELSFFSIWTLTAYLKTRFASNKGESREVSKLLKVWASLEEGLTDRRLNYEILKQLNKKQLDRDTNYIFC